MSFGMDVTYKRNRQYQIDIHDQVYNEEAFIKRTLLTEGYFYRTKLEVVKLCEDRLEMEKQVIALSFKGDH